MQCTKETGQQGQTMIYKTLHRQLKTNNKCTTETGQQGQTMIYKTLHRQLKVEQHEIH